MINDEKSRHEAISVRQPPNLVKQDWAKISFLIHNEIQHWTLTLPTLSTSLEMVIAHHKSILSNKCQVNITWGQYLLVQKDHFKHRAPISNSDFFEVVNDQTPTRITRKNRKLNRHQSSSLWLPNPNKLTTESGYISITNTWARSARERSTVSHPFKTLPKRCSNQIDITSLCHQLKCYLQLVRKWIKKCPGESSAKLASDTRSDHLTDVRDRKHALVLV